MRRKGKRERLRSIGGEGYQRRLRRGSRRLLRRSMHPYYRQKYRMSQGGFIITVVFFLVLIILSNFVEPNLVLVLILSAVYLAFIAYDIGGKSISNKSKRAGS